MGKYQVEVNGQKFEIEAPDEKALSVAVSQLQAQGDVPAAAGKPERSGGIDGAVRAMGRGVLGIGSYLDEINAGFNASLAPVIDPLLPDQGYEKLPGKTWGERYDQALDIQRRKDAEYDKDSPVLSTGLKIAGGVGSGLGLLKAAPTVGSYVMGNTGASLPARVAATIGSGVGTGAVQGFGAGEDGISERGKQALIEAGTGGLTAGIMMPVAAGISAGAKKVGGLLLGESDDALSTMSREARKYVNQELVDPNKVALYRQSLDDLGPEAMLADVSPDWLGVARGAAARPGTRGMVVDPLNERSGLANARLRSDVAANLGPDPIPSLIDKNIKGSLKEVARNYGPVFQNKSSFDFTPITKDLDQSISVLRGPAQHRLQQVRGMLNEFGEDAVTTDPSIAFQTRQAIDGILKDETNDKVISALSEARQMIDDALTRSVPRLKEVDASYSELARQEKALTQGRPILNNEASAMRPVELEETLREGALPQGLQVGPSAVPTRMRQSTLGEIYRAVGTKANDITALRNLVRGEGDWNREKLGLLFGQDPADSVLNAIDRETVFGDTANRVTRGSDTAMANRFSKFLDDVEKAQDIPTDTTLPGLGIRGVREIARLLMRNNASANASQVAEDIGKLSVAQGDARDEIINALLRRGRENTIDQQRRAVIDAIVQGSGRAGYPSLPGVR